MATWAWALTFQPVDKDGGTNPAAVPIGDVLGASISYGKRGDALTYSGGTMVLELDNTDSKYTPDAGGTYSNARFLGVEVKLYADVTGAGAPTWTHGPPAAFTGYVADIDYTFSDTYNATVTVTVVDALTMLGTLSFDGGSYGFTLDSGPAPPAPFSPLDLSPLVWYDASDTGTITESSGSVSQWDDKSGNGYDLTQATSSEQPKTGTATINSLNVLEYDLTNNSQRIVNSSVPLTGTSYTMFAVYEINSNDTLYALLSTSNASGYAYLGWSGNTGSLHSQMSGLSLHINGVEFTGTNRDDVYTAVGNAPVVLRVQFTSSTYNGLSFGYNLRSAVTFGFGTKVAEAFVAASPTAQEITDAETYLANKWGITL